eukprot:scaffold153_cov347-Pavlova_lutheri.AAC.3
MDGDATSGRTTKTWWSRNTPSDPWDPTSCVRIETARPDPARCTTPMQGRTRPPAPRETRGRTRTPPARVDPTARPRTRRCRRFGTNRCVHFRRGPAGAGGLRACDLPILVATPLVPSRPPGRTGRPRRIRRIPTGTPSWRSSHPTKDRIPFASKSIPRPSRRSRLPSLLGWRCFALAGPVLSFPWPGVSF